MAQDRQARNMTEGTYGNCSAMYVERDEEVAVDKWVEGVEVSITASWARILLPDGSSKRFLRKTNRTLQIYPDMSRLQAEAERHLNRVINSHAPNNPAHLGVTIHRPAYSNTDKVDSWDSLYYDRMELCVGRGWSGSQIKWLLSTWDEVDTDNPHRLPIQKRFLTGSRLYLRSRVHKIEASPDWTPGKPQRAQVIP